MDINNFSFAYKQLSQSNHPARPNNWECLILNKETNTIFGVRFDAPFNVDPRQDNTQIFNAFCDKKTFKEQFFIETGEVVIEKPIEEIPVKPIEVIENKPVENPPPAPDSAFEIVKNDEKVVDPAASNV